MKKRHILALAVLAVLITSSILAYYLHFKTITNDDILAHGWKGGGCGLPDVLDFRGGHLTLSEDSLYIGDKLIGRIVKREYRAYADSFIEVRSETDEICPYWAKWKNH